MTDSLKVLKLKLYDRMCDGNKIDIFDIIATKIESSENNRVDNMNVKAIKAIIQKPNKTVKENIEFLQNKPKWFYEGELEEIMIQSINEHINELIVTIRFFQNQISDYKTYESIDKAIETLSDLIKYNFFK